MLFFLFKLCLYVYEQLCWWKYWIITHIPTYYLYHFFCKHPIFICIMYNTFFFDIHYCSVSTNHSGWAPLVDWRYHRKEYSYTRKLLPCLGTWQYCFSWWLNMYLLKLVISAFISFDFILTKCNCQSQIRRWWKSQSCNHPNSWKVIKTIKSVKSTLNQY